MDAKKTLTTFELSHHGSVIVRMRPLVILTILDAYVRRSDNPNSERVLGTLLGNVTEGNVVDVTDCFVNKHKDNVHNNRTGAIVATLVEVDYHKNMIDLKARSNNKEIVVGWFSTGSDLSTGCANTHQFFCSKDSLFSPHGSMTSPIQLLVDTGLKDSTLSIKAYLSVPIPIIRGDAVMQFVEVPMQMFGEGPETPTLSMLLRALESEEKAESDDSNSIIKSELQNSYKFANALADLDNMLSACGDYVDRVLDGSVSGDLDIGRQLFTVLCCEPLFDTKVFETVCNEKLSDLLMVIYLTNALRCQIRLSEKMVQCSGINPSSGYMTSDRDY
eukprot:Platyproteum_vivax@DN2026_c0_g1_i1.p1